MDKCLISVSSITSQFCSFLHWIVFDLFFYCVTVKTIYNKLKLKTEWKNKRRKDSPLQYHYVAIRTRELNIEIICLWNKQTFSDCQEKTCTGMSSLQSQWECERQWESLKVSGQKQSRSLSTTCTHNYSITIINNLLQLPQNYGAF